MQITKQGIISKPVSLDRKPSQIMRNENLETPVGKKTHI